MTAPAISHSPKLFKYSLGVSIALIVLIPLWMVVVTAFIQPESRMTQEQAMSDRLLWWAAAPVVAVSLIFGGRWAVASKTAQVMQQQVRMQKQQVGVTDQSRREYVLEVIGLGVTLDKFRQGALWDALQKGSPYVTIREQDVKKYPWSNQDKDGTSGGRGGDSLENGAQYTPMYYGVPVFNAEPAIHNNAEKDTPDKPRSGLASGAISSGMAWHLFVVGPRRFEEHPDRLLEQVFTLAVSKTKCNTPSCRVLRCRESIPI
jgi:hypothetical protein